VEVLKRTLITACLIVAGLLAGRVLSVALTRVSGPWQMEAYLRRHPLRKLQIGAGSANYPDWLNTDINPSKEQVYLDATKRFALPDGSIQYIFGEHVIEHIPKPDAERLLREIHRVLQPGGVIRLSTPDAGKFLRAYVNDRDFLADPRFAEAAETSMDRVNMMMREYGQHLWVYDIELISLVLQRAGFSSVREQEFGASTHPRMQGIDLAEREFESLYVEAIK